MDIRDIKKEIIGLVELIAAAALRHQKPVKDEISYRQACREFTAAWIKYHNERNNIKWTRRGKYENSAKVTSRLELLALREAENRGAQIARDLINNNA